MKTPLTVDMTKLVGVAYEKMDCFQLVKRFYQEALDTEVFNAIPYGEDNWERSVLIHTHKNKFVEVPTPKYGDIVVIKIHGLECHLGVVLEGNRFLHTTKKTGAVIDQLGRWRKLIAGYYRLEEAVTSGYQD